jgi:hypothetical protein
MLHASTQQLIRKLYELTSAGNLAWAEGAPGSSRLETEGYVVEIAAAPPTLRLLRADGRELETATPDDLAEVAWPSGDGTYATRVTEMAGRANRIALGAEQAIATILSALSAPAMKPAHELASQPAGTFGETTSFAKAEAIEPIPRPPPKPPAVNMVAPDMLALGISARSAQGVEQSTAASLERFAPVALKPQSALRPAAFGPNIYKPWN